MQLTSNTRAFVESEQYSDFILLNLHDGLLSGDFYRNVMDFQSGEVLHIKTVGEVTLQEAAEDTPLVYNPIESGEVTLRVTEYKGDAWYVTDELREDGAQIESLLAQRAMESTRAIQEVFETDFLKAANDAQTAGNANNVNGFAHRVIASGPNDTLDLEDLVDMRLAFDKANVPAMGRIFICDPVAEATLSKKVNITTDVTDFAKGIIQNGMASGQRFLMNLYGWDIMTSNRLPTVASETIGSDTISDGVANIAMCVADDNCKPIMGVWRRMPRSEGDRNKDLRRDEHMVTCRYGFGPQRNDTLGVILTSRTATK